MTRRGAALTVAVLVTATAAVDASKQPDPQNLKTLSIEELMEIDVTLAARRPEPVGTTAAAVSVVTGDDIRRAGVTTIADAIALATGVHVARFGNGSWAISARGFNATSANKLLVMIDGRTEFSPLFSGVFWNMVDYVLEDIDRIEVIRGPGATLWGTNAVNGVINIVTRSARDTQGTLLSIGAGNEDPFLGEVRYGGTVGGAAYRVYAKHARRGSQRLPSGEPAQNSRRREQVGFRLDAGTPGGTSWLLKGDAFHSRDSFFDRADGEFSELAVHGQWARTFESTARLQMNAYYRREYRRVPLQLTHHLDTADLDLQHAVPLGRRHQAVFGGGFRINFDRTHGGTVAFVPERRTYPLLSAFVQDEMAVLPDRLFLTAGLKVEHNRFSGAEWQPNVRARFLLPRAQTVWGAVSRAVRRPTRVDMDVISLAPTGVVAVIGGGESFGSEDLLATEIGYRTQLAAGLAFDATAFVHAYDDVRSQELPRPGPIVLGNTLNGLSRGLELGINVQPHDRWRSLVSYTYLDVDITRDPESRDVGRGASEANDPRHLFTLRSSIDLPRAVEIDAVLRSVSRLERTPVPGYTELNLRVGWRPTDRLELSVAGQDLLHDAHPEFGPPGPFRIEFERSVRAMVTVRLP